MRVVIAGASGFLGTHLSDHLRVHGHEVTALVRRETCSAHESRWDPAAGRVDTAVIEGADAVVNLAGASIAGNPHSRKWAREVLESRVSTTRLLAETIAASERPAAFLAGIGAEHDLLIASELRWDGADGAFARHRRGAAKRDALLAAGVDLGAATFFTDSFDDQATAALAGELVLVHPSDRALRRYAASGLAFTVLPVR